MKYTLSENDITELTDLFKYYSGGKNHMDIDELTVLWYELGITDENELNKIIHTMVTNNIITLENFIKYMAIYINSTISNDELLELFKIMDKNNDNLLDRNDILLCIQGMGIDITLEEASEIIYQFDINGNGFLDFNEFKKMLNP